MEPTLLETVATFRDASAAHIAKGALAVEGVDAVVVDEHLVGVNWLYSDAIGGVKLAVPAAQVSQALDLLKDLETDPGAEPDSAPRSRLGRAVGIVAVLTLAAFAVPGLIVGLPLLGRNRRAGKRNQSADPESPLDSF
ncbi:DUF2007 domain-containing protein [bacterium]|nr:DUF2007 domain-containing protein [bacterium]